MRCAGGREVTAGHLPCGCWIIGASEGFNGGTISMIAMERSSRQPRDAIFASLLKTSRGRFGRVSSPGTGGGPTMPLKVLPQPKEEK